MKQKIKLLEPAGVYNQDDIKSPPFFEIPVDTEVEIRSIKIKAWKTWLLIELPDGRKGLISGKVKALHLQPDPPKTKAGGFPNVKLALKGLDPEIKGHDLVDCVREYTDELTEAIRKDKNPERMIINCSEAGADWMLQENVIDEKKIGWLVKKAYENKPLSLTALLHIERARNRTVIDDDLISYVVEEVKKDVSVFKRKWYSPGNIEKVVLS